MNKPALSIIKLNGQCSLQDLGRASAQHIGFTAGGAADEYSFRYANNLLNNKENTAALEIMLGQISLQAHTNFTLVITGANCFAHVNGEAVANNKVFQLHNKDVLTLEQPKLGIYSYIAIAGGIDAKRFYNSCSQSINESHLGLFTEKIQEGSKLSLSPRASKVLTNKSDNAPKQNLELEKNKDPARTNQSTTKPNLFHQTSLLQPASVLTLRFIPSQLFDELDTETQQAFTSQIYAISPQSNRMGYRLKGDSLIAQDHNKTDIENIRHPQSQKQEQNQNKLLAGTLSKPVCFGSIQLPENGQPIVLMKDRQTIGGYPLLGTVMQIDLFRLSQKRPGESVRFIAISVEAAQQQLISFYKKFKH